MSFDSSRDKLLENSGKCTLKENEIKYMKILKVVFTYSSRAQRSRDEYVRKVSLIEIHQNLLHFINPCFLTDYLINCNRFDCLAQLDIVGSS